MQLTTPSIAIVDDDQAVLKTLARLLDLHGFNVRTFTSAHEFLDSLSSGLPKYLIVDFQMPEMTGLELQQHLLARKIHIPTIVITGRGDRVVQEKCVSAGAVAFLLKPLQVQTLLDAIEKAGASAAG